MGCDVVLALQIEAEPGTVYEAITTQKGEAAFWTSDNETEPTKGSVAIFRFPSSPAPARMRVDELEPEQRVTWACLGDFPGWERSTVTWELEGRDGGTHLFFRHGGLGAGYQEHDLASIAWVWAQVLGRLKGYAETATPQPFFG
jgi:uncharacterized protein YndB with AHSA1/START domain